MADPVFYPNQEFSNRAIIGSLDQYRDLYEKSMSDPDTFWSTVAERITWYKKWDTVRDFNFVKGNIKWFDGAKLNVSYNCLDRHVEAGHGSQTAIIWEGNNPEEDQAFTYSELLAEVQKFANVLKNLGVDKGDRVCLYMQMIPQLPIAMLACARIGAVHSVVFGAFSPDSLRDRINDSACKVLVTQDTGVRGTKQNIPMKTNADKAVTETPSIEHVIVVQRTGEAVEMVNERDHWWQEEMKTAEAECEPEEMNAEDPLFILYTSGSTGKPKGVLHTSGGYLVYTSFTHENIFDYQPGDIYWCTADIGWITGHSYIVYGPLTNGCTSVMYEGTPDTPLPEHRSGDRSQWPKDRLWDIIERYGVTQLYTAPTAIRTFMKWGESEPAGHDLSSLRVLGTVGEPINPEAWIWYHENIGGGSCPIVDTWWQTETGGHMISPLPGVTTTKPGSACSPIPGVFAELVDDAGYVVERGGGYLTISQPWPSMLRGIWGDPERYYDTYWSRFEGRYFAGDGAKLDEDGYLWLLGRVDDVMNVSGHRISTAEVESALVDHPAVAEAAVVGATDAITGQAIVAYVILRSAYEASDDLGEEVRGHVAIKLGPTARPRAVFLVPDLPKTRSGKIMRRLLRDVAEGRDLGDTTTLADSGVVDEIRTRATESQHED